MTISALGWVSFGSAEVEAVNALIGAFTDSEARDELGIGAIRDGFSDLLFPGTSTVQTRLRYFLMIPQIFQDIDLRVHGRQQEPTGHQERAGLHAKIFITENADETTITLGSGNATSAGLAVSGMRNIEVFATLRGKTATVGGIGLDSEGILGHDGLRPLLADWSPRSLSEEEVDEARFEDDVRQARHAIFAARPQLTFASVEDQWSAPLQMKCPAIPGIMQIHARLATQHGSTAIARAGPWILGASTLPRSSQFLLTALLIIMQLLDIMISIDLNCLRRGNPSVFLTIGVAFLSGRGKCWR